MQLSTFVVAAETSYLVKGQCIWLFVFFRFVGLSPSTGLCFYGWLLGRHVVNPAWPT